MISHECRLFSRKFELFSIECRMRWQIYVIINDAYCSGIVDLNISHSFQISYQCYHNHSTGGSKCYAFQMISWCIRNKLTVVSLCPVRYIVLPRNPIDCLEWLLQRDFMFRIFLQSGHALTRGTNKYFENSFGCNERARQTEWTV